MIVVVSSAYLLLVCMPLSISSRTHSHLYKSFFFMVSYIRGDLFSHTSSQAAVLAHACNPFGLWGGGIAAVFKRKFPSAYKLYANHCKQQGPNLMGTSLLLPTEPNDPGNNGNPPLYIACLFTSDFNSPPSEIVENTRKSMLELSHQLLLLTNVEKDSEKKVVVNMPMINSGIFNVPWEQTEAVLEKCPELHINVYTI